MIALFGLSHLSSHLEYFESLAKQHFQYMIRTFVYFLFIVVYFAVPLHASTEEGISAADSLFPPVGTLAPVTHSPAGLDLKLFQDLQLPSKAPDKHSIYIYEGAKALQECVKDAEAQSITRHNEEAELPYSCYVEYRDIQKSDTEMWFEFLTTRRPAASSTIPQAATSVAASSLLPQQLNAGFLCFIFSVSIHETPREYTAVLSYGPQGWRKIKPGYIENLGFDVLTASGVIEDEEFFKAAKWESLFEDNKRMNSSRTRHPSRPEEHGLDRVEQRLKEVEVKTALSKRGMKVTREKMDFPVAALNRASEKERPFTPDQSVITLSRICQGLMQLKFASKDPRMEQRFRFFAPPSQEEMSAMYRGFLQAFRDSENYFIFLMWDKLEQRKVNRFQYLRADDGFELPLIHAIRTVPPLKPTLLDEEVTVCYEEGPPTTHRVFDIFQSAPFPYDNHEYYAFLDAGGWSKIPSTLVAAKRRFLSHRVLSALELSLIPFSASEHSTSAGESEASYSVALAESLSQTPGSTGIGLDRKTRYTGFTFDVKEPSFEFADTIAYNNERLYVVHTKRMSEHWKSEPLSHLFFQADVATAVVTDDLEMFSRGVIRKVESECPEEWKKKILDKLRVKDFTIVTAIVLPRNAEAMSDSRGYVNLIPYFSVHSAYDTALRIESRGFPYRLAFIERKVEMLSAAPSTATVSPGASAAAVSSSNTSGKRKRANATKSQSSRKKLQACDE